MPSNFIGFLDVSQAFYSLETIGGICVGATFVNLIFCETDFSNDNVLVICYMIHTYILAHFATIFKFVKINLL